MKVFRFIIIMIIFGWYLLQGIHVAGANNAQETLADSIIAPNIFTPNGDGQNDVFEVKSKNGNKVALKVFTRAGVLVFSIEAKLCCWDGCSLSGQPMANGVYYWTAETTDVSPKISRSGFVHLYR